jgi:hypothetical protein
MGREQGLDPAKFCTHSLLRTNNAVLCQWRTGNLRAGKVLLGNAKIERRYDRHLVVGVALRATDCSNAAVGECGKMEPYAVHCSVRGARQKVAQIVGSATVGIRPHRPIVDNMITAMEKTISIQ